jgi:hypothetical protein
MNVVGLFKSHSSQTRKQILNFLSAHPSFAENSKKLVESIGATSHESFMPAIQWKNEENTLLLMSPDCC